MSNLKKLEIALGNHPELEIALDNIKPIVSADLANSSDFTYVAPIMSASEYAEFEAELRLSSERVKALINSLHGIHGVGMPHTKVSMTFKNPKKVQVRRHKKKRINKKWAKRYGYKILVDKYAIRDVSIVRDDSIDALGYAQEQLYKFMGIPDVIHSEVE